MITVVGRFAVGWPWTQTEMQQVVNKLDELILALRR
jgi:hypothetical protein